VGPPVQIAYAVPDLTAAIHRFVEGFGAGPFFVRPHIELVEVTYRGRPGVFDHSAAYGQWGTVMVELVEDHSPGPSPIRDLYLPGQQGLHHLAFLVDDVTGELARLEAEGHEIALSATTRGGTEFHLVDTIARYGHMVELYRPTDSLLAFYALVAGAADGWDGSQPLR
jgi:catechol 2,3-dioxygenase-like lactoylglutathione lyase family enzyme